MPIPAGSDLPLWKTCANFVMRWNVIIANKELPSIRDRGSITCGKIRGLGVFRNQIDDNGRDIVGTAA